MATNLAPSTESLGKWITRQLAFVKGAWPKFSLEISGDYWKEILVEKAERLGRAKTENAWRRCVRSLADLDGLTLPRFEEALGRATSVTTCPRCEASEGWEYFTVLGEKNPRVRRCQHGAGLEIEEYRA